MERERERERGRERERERQSEKGVRAPICGRLVKYPRASFPLFTQTGSVAMFVSVSEVFMNR